MSDFLKVILILLMMITPFIGIWVAGFFGFPLGFFIGLTAALVYLEVILFLGIRLIDWVERAV